MEVMYYHFNNIRLCFEHSLVVNKAKGRQCYSDDKGTHALVSISDDGMEQEGFACGTFLPSVNLEDPQEGSKALGSLLTHSTIGNPACH